MGIQAKLPTANKQENSLFRDYSRDVVISRVIAITNRLLVAKLL